MQLPEPPPKPRVQEPPQVPAGMEAELWVLASPLVHACMHDRLILRRILGIIAG